MNDSNHRAVSRLTPGTHLRGGAKVLVRACRDSHFAAGPLAKPRWVHTRAGNSERIVQMKTLLREKHLTTVCEESRCPNLQECFSAGTATFMIMGNQCTRRCSFCDVAHGRPSPLEKQEPRRLATMVQTLGLAYVVITSVDRDDLRDGGATHFSDCVHAVRAHNPDIKIEILVPDFRGRLDVALRNLCVSPCDVLGHNVETVSSLYAQVRPGSDYAHSLQVLKRHKVLQPDIPTKSGLMLGLGESPLEVERVLEDLRANDVDILTIGQYLCPGKGYRSVRRYAPLEEFAYYRELGRRLGFRHVESGPLVRSSYHAEQQFAE